MNTASISEADMAVDITSSISFSWVFFSFSFSEPSYEERHLSYLINGPVLMTSVTAEAVNPWIVLDAFTYPGFPMLMRYQERTHCVTQYKTEQ